MFTQLSYLLFSSLMQGVLPASTPYVAGNTSFATQCAGFRDSLTLSNTTVWFTEHYTAGSNISLPDNHPTCGQSSQVVEAEICRIALFIETGPASNLSFEAWFPSDWTGRFLSTGNGGLSGCIQYEDIAYGAQNGFATVSANNGHNGTSGEDFYKSPGVLEDFVYRSVHTGVVIGKEVTQQFYGKKHDKSYYLGCSTGGRQGFKSAQDFPDDFDGIVAGAPAMNFIGLQSYSGSRYNITGPADRSTHLSRTDWSLVTQNVLDQCDELDGVKDGIIEDTDLCQYRPEALLCSEGQTNGCLSSAQVEAVRELQSPLYGNDGSWIYPRVPPGGIGYYDVFLTGPFPYASDWWKYVVYDDPSWDPTTLGPDDFDAAFAQNPWNIQTWEGNLSSVRDRGAKILHWHGLQDGLISSEDSQVYYDRVSRTMGLHSTDLDDFYRYFRISGASHCATGDGASNIGNNLGNLGGNDPSNNVLKAIVHWVEGGVAPDTIEGWRFANGTQGNEIEYKRRHCRYPYRNVWDRKGNSTDPDSWSCQL